MDKYYTPEIEEFHVGFEFEMADTWGGWMKLTLTENLLKYPLVSLGSGNDRTPYYHKTKVKYLDREDIESLGFFDCQKTVCTWYKLEGKFEDSFATYGYWTKIRLIHCFDKIKILAYEYSWEEEGTVLYQGKCKNKSELKKLLKQLNINE